MYRSVSQSDESIRGDAQTLFLCCDGPDFKNFPDFNESTRKSGNARPPRSFVTHF